MDDITWFKVDDQLAFHPKVIMAGNAAMGLWVRAGSWSGAHLTQGLLPAGMVATLGGHKRDARRLVEVGLWEQVDAGYQFKDWCDYQPSKQQVEGDRAATKERQQRYRDRQSNAVTLGVTAPVTNGVTNGAVTHTRPDPYLRDKEPTSAKPPREDVELLCKRLHDRIEGNGSKVTVTEGWRTAARLMLDRDHRELDKALRLIDWCQDDEFWRGVVLSMPKFRVKYDQMRLRAVADGERESVPTTPDAAREWLKTQWKTGTVTAIEERTKLSYAVPDLPDSITTGEQAREFHLRHRRDWITAHADEIIAALGQVAA